MASQDLLRLITRNRNCFLRKNLIVNVTCDPFSATNIPMAKDAGFLKKNAVCVTQGDNETAKVTRLTRNRKKVSKKRRKPLETFTYTSSEVPVKNLKVKGLYGKRADKLRTLRHLANRRQRN